MSKRDAGIMRAGFLATAAVGTVAAAYEDDAATRYAMIGVVGSRRDHRECLAGRITLG